MERNLNCSAGRESVNVSFKFEVLEGPSVGKDLQVEFVYYEMIKRKRLCGGLEHLKKETRLIDERFASAMGECMIVTLKVLRLYSK